MPMNSSSGPMLIRMASSEMPLDGGACLISTLWWIRSSTSFSSRRGAIVVPLAPSFFSKVIVFSSSEKSTLRMRSFATSSTNWEYTTSWPPPIFGLKLWNTTISTTATTTHNIKFLAKSFILYSTRESRCSCRRRAGQLALREGVHLGRPLARRRGFADRHLGITPPQLPHVIVEAHALEQLDQERTAGLQVAVGELHRQFCEVHGPRLVDRIHATLVGGHVRKNKVHERLAQRLLQS